MAIRKNESFPFVTTWMGLEGTTVSEINQTQKDKSVFFLYVDY